MPPAPPRRPGELRGARRTLQGRRPEFDGDSIQECSGAERSGGTHWLHALVARSGVARSRVARPEVADAGCIIGGTLQRCTLEGLHDLLARSGCTFPLQLSVERSQLGTSALTTRRGADRIRRFTGFFGHADRARIADRQAHRRIPAASTRLRRRLRSRSPTGGARTFATGWGWRESRAPSEPSGTDDSRGTASCV